MRPEALPTDELKRRIDAARTLRGLKQTELAEKFHADGLGKHDVGRIERGEIAMRVIHRDALCRHLGVPKEWFTEPSVDILLGFSAPAGQWHYWAEETVGQKPPYVIGHIFTPEGEYVRALPGVKGYEQVTLDVAQMPAKLWAHARTQQVSPLTDAQAAVLGISVDRRAA